MAHNHHEHNHCEECEHSHSGLNIEVGCCDGCCSHEHAHAHNHEKSKDQRIYEIITIVLSLLLLFASLIPFLSSTIKLLFCIASAVLSGYELVPEAFEGLKKLKLDENLLVLIAVVAAFCIGDFFEAAAVSIFFKIGESIEDYAVDKSKRAIEKLYEITSDKATVLTDDGETLEVDAQDVKIGDVVIVSPFEKIPIDCVALEDGGSVDASAITGEAVPIEVAAGMNILSGSVNGSRILKLKAIAEFKDSAASKIIKTVEDSQAAKGNTDKFISKFASLYTPVVVLGAVLLAVIPSIVTGEWAKFIHRALVFLVASCPCALVLSIPLGFFAAIGAQSKKGIIVKGGKFIEKLAKTDAVLFDKTGTLTDNEFEVEKVYAFGGLSEENVLSIAALGEKYSTHPLAHAILKAHPNVNESLIENFEEISGHGTKISVQGKTILCGSAKLMKQNGIDTASVRGAQVYVAINNNLIGAVSISGKLRSQSKNAVEKLFELGIKKVVMLTGDNENAAKSIADKCGIEEYKFGLLPNQKTEILEQYIEEGYSPAFVGDGINDAPTLARADVGIAMGTGTAAAIEVGDVVLMNPNPENIANAIKMSRRAMNVIRFNIAFALAVKIIVLVLGALGKAPMWAAVFADVGVCVIDVLNASRLLISKK